MDEETNSMPVPGKSKTGSLFAILCGLVLVGAALVYGVYWSGSGQRPPDLKIEDSFKLKDYRIQDKKAVESLLTEPVNQSEKIPENGIQENPRESPPPMDQNPQLPQLDVSDVAVRDLLSGLSNRREYAQWIGFDHLVRKIVLATDNISRGAIPIRHFKFMIPKEKFLVVAKGSDHYLIDPQGYQRYNIYADTLASIDIPAGFRVYQTLKPLLDLAYQELGNPESDFDQPLRRAINHLLAAPVLSGEVLLVRPSVMYRFADPEIEALSLAQKQLIRMGPRNTHSIQSVLRGFLTGMGSNDSKFE